MEKKKLAHLRRAHIIAELVESMRVAQIRASNGNYCPHPPQRLEPVVVRRNQRIGVWKGGC